MRSIMHQQQNHGIQIAMFHFELDNTALYVFWINHWSGTAWTSIAKNGNLIFGLLAYNDSLPRFHTRRSLIYPDV